MTDLEVERFESSGCTIRIMYDADAQNPREEYDRASTIYYVSTRQLLGDEVVPRDDFGDLIKDLESTPNTYTYRLYAYVHSGVALSLSDFNDPWDSGMCGVVHVSAKDIKNVWGDKAPTEAQVREAVEAELVTWQAYLNGECYGFVIEHSGEELESCWGYYDITSARDDAVNVASIVAPKEPVKKLIVTIGPNTFRWINIGPDANQMFHNYKIRPEKCDTLEDAWCLVMTVGEG